jgi:hypothetical protein
MPIAPKAAAEPRHKTVPEERMVRILPSQSVKIDSDS